MPTVNGKPIQFVSTALWSQKFGGIKGAMYICEAMKCLTKHPVDMLVFETKNDRMQIRSAGYDLATDSKLDETTVVTSFASLPTEKFWLKVDNYGDKYVATFLFPHEN